MKDIKVALIGGAGFMGRAHSLGYSLASVLGGLDARVHKSVLVDVDPDAANRAATELGWESASSDWRAVVADPDIDVIDIVTPPGLHREIALEAIAHGKHVFCEKPITNDLPSAIEMSDAAVRAGVTTQVGFNYRHISAISHIRNLIDSGRLGVPLHFRGEYLTDALFFIDDFGWRGSRASGGSGATGDIGSHLIDLAEYLLGPISRVSAVQRTKQRESPGDGWFDEQTRRVDDRLDDAGLTTVEATTAHPDVWYPVPGLGQGYLDGTAIQIRRFLNAVATGGTGAPDFASAVRVQRVVDAVEESARSGAWVDVQLRVAAR
jgi:predicted dehydrogenase